MKFVLKLLMVVSAIAGVLALLIGGDFGYSRWWAILLAPAVLFAIYTIFKSAVKPQERYHITE